MCPRMCLTLSWVSWTASCPAWVTPPVHNFLPSSRALLLPGSLTKEHIPVHPSLHLSQHLPCRPSPAGLRFISALPSSIPLGALRQEPGALRTFHVTPGAFLGCDQVKPQKLSLLTGGNPCSLRLSSGICPVWVGFACGTGRTWHGAGVGGLAIVPRGAGTARWAPGTATLHSRGARGADNPQVWVPSQQQGPDP